MPEGGGEPTPVTRLDPGREDDSHRHPRFLPDGRHFLYLARTAIAGQDHAIVVGSIDGDDGPVLLTSPTAAEYASGHLLFIRDLTLMAQPFDAHGLELDGAAFPVAEDVRLVAAGTALSVFSASQTGVLAYEPGGALAGQSLVWRDREGKELGVLGDEAGYWDVRLSPLGDLAMVTIEAPRGDVWIYEISRNLRTRLTFSNEDDVAGAWSPDGSTVFYSTSRGSAYDIYSKTVGGAGQEERVHEAGLVSLPTSVSPDGRLLAFSEQSGGTNWDLWILPLDGADEPYPFLQEPFDELVGVFSPDGRWMAYHSNESGRAGGLREAVPRPGADMAGVDRRREVGHLAGGRERDHLPGRRRDPDRSARVDAGRGAGLRHAGAPLPPAPPRGQLPVLTDS